MPLPYTCPSTDEMGLVALKIYKARFLWLCMVSLSLFSTVWGGIFAFPLEFGVNCSRSHSDRIYSRIASFQAPTRPIWRGIDGVVGYMVAGGMDTVWGISSEWLKVCMQFNLHMEALYIGSFSIPRLTRIFFLLSQTTKFIILAFQQHFRLDLGNVSAHAKLPTG